MEKPACFAIAKGLEGYLDMGTWSGTSGCNLTARAGMFVKFGNYMFVSGAYFSPSSMVKSTAPTPNRPTNDD